MRLHVYNERTLKRFNKLKDKYSKIVIKYHMDGCGHCEQFKSTWKQCTLKANNKKILLVNLNRSILDSPNLDKKFKQIIGFPTIKLFTKKNNRFNIKTFKKERSKKNVIKFMKS